MATPLNNSIDINNAAEHWKKEGSYEELKAGNPSDDVARKIDSTLYGQSAQRRLPIFEEICPSHGKKQQQ